MWNIRNKIYKISGNICRARSSSRFTAGSSSCQYSPACANMSWACGHFTHSWEWILFQFATKPTFIDGDESPTAREPSRCEIQTFPASFQTHLILIAPSRSFATMTMTTTTWTIRKFSPRFSLSDNYSLRIRLRHETSPAQSSCHFTFNGAVAVRLVDFHVAAITQPRRRMIKKKWWSYAIW